MPERAEKKRMIMLLLAIALCVHLLSGCSTGVIVRAGVSMNAGAGINLESTPCPTIMPTVGMSTTALEEKGTLKKLDAEIEELLEKIKKSEEALEKVENKMHTLEDKKFQLYKELLEQKKFLSSLEKKREEQNKIMAFFTDMRIDWSKRKIAQLEKAIDEVDNELDEIYVVLDKMRQPLSEMKIECGKKQLARLEEIKRQKALKKKQVSPIPTPTAKVSVKPALVPTIEPRVEMTPNQIQSAEPTPMQPVEPTLIPTTEPTSVLTTAPTDHPLAVPSQKPTTEPSGYPSVSPE